MPSPAVPMFTQKEGIRTTRPQTRTTFDRSLGPNNSPHPSVPPTLHSLPFAPPHLSTLKTSTQTYSKVLNMIQSPKTTSAHSNLTRTTHPGHSRTPDSSFIRTASMSRTTLQFVGTSDSELCKTNMTIRPLDTSDKPRPSNSSFESSHGQASAETCKTLSNHVYHVPVARLLVTNHMDSSSNFRSQHVLGIQFPWTLSSNSHLRTSTLPYW